jgi:hypothetical protein
LIGKHLGRQVALATDAAALAIVTAAGPSIPTTGTTVANLIADIKAAFAAVTIGSADSRDGGSKLYWVMNSALAASLSARLAGSTGWNLVPTGGTLAGVPVVVSAGAPNGVMILVDASRFAAASEEAITLERITEGVVQFETAPDSPSTASTILVSLWQENKVGQVAKRYFGLVALTATAAATITGMT